MNGASSSSCPVSGGAYQAIGGLEGCRKLSASFYSRVRNDPVLRPLFPGTLKCPIEGLALFLAQFLGGPCEYSRKRRWSLSLREAHLRFKIGQNEREAWLKNMAKALVDCDIDPDTRNALRRWFEESSAYLVNQEKVQCPGNSADDEMAGRWQVHRTLEETVAAVRAGETDRALGLLKDTRLQAYMARDRAAFLSVLAIMAASETESLRDFVLQELAASPELAHERYTYGRTLLHDAAGSGSVLFAEALLHIGADPNATDDRGHTPLYALGNSAEGIGDGSALVRLFANAGANLDAKDNVKHCTALHMAARRGHVRIAEALLDCGADLESKDSAGDTPLRRAVNCGKAGVAAMLLSRGADIRSIGSKGLSPLQAARGAAMKKVLQA